ncbi:hypothetical protein [Streptomyces longisporoflavus]|uniref:hypothetical protein n=1 Tax=Streptomyces longisporoflavus TaxID=28044 RepID=UPI00167D284A|nr:hypothetical protein [Streptomyces longisporoflavus]
MADKRCVHEMLVEQCTECAPPPDGLPSHVFVTAGGSVFHRTTRCAGLLDGQRQAGRQGKEIHTPERKPLAEARGRFGACLICCQGYRPGTARR